MCIYVPAMQMIDVGCGIGGSSRHIVRSKGGKATGISLSPVQVHKASLNYLWFIGALQVLLFCSKLMRYSPHNPIPRMGQHIFF